MRNISWVQSGRGRPTPSYIEARRRPVHEVHAMTWADVELARELMRGPNGLSLKAAALAVGVLTRDLDVALWRMIGGGY